VDDVEQLIPALKFVIMEEIKIASNI